MLLDVNVPLLKFKYCYFGLCQKTSKVDSIYLAFTNFKISCKKDQK